MRRLSGFARISCGVVAFSLSSQAFASEHYGQVLSNGFPVPGATVTATQGSTKLVTSSDVNGRYVFPDLADGTWKIEIEMLCFAKLSQQITVAAGAPGVRFDLKMLPLEEVLAQTRSVVSAPVLAENRSSAPGSTLKAAPTKPAESIAPKPPSEESAQANDGFLVNGSVNNAATSQFSLDQAFGNTRNGSKSLYTGGFGAMFGNSALDARPFSLSGVEIPKSEYNKLTLIASFGGPLRIPHLMPHGPNFFVNYQWTRNRVGDTATGLVPTEAERNGTLPGGDVTTISPQAEALLALYPLPNLAGNATYNFEIPVVNSSHQDAMQMRLDKDITRRDQLYGNFAFQSTRASNLDLFSFVDTTDTLGLNGSVNWAHRLNGGLYLNTGYRFSRLRSTIAPFFADRFNVSGAAGINGNDQDPAYWGPPTLVFSSGIASLSDGQSAFDRNRTDGINPSLQWYHGHHNVTLGGDFRRQEFNYFSQENPRGTFTFTGAGSGSSDLADFLTGVPDTSTLAFGNADKYLRQSVYDAYGTDDWRLRPELTLNVGVRWEYGAPITELKNRLVNLDVASGFSAVAPVLASDPTGPLTGQPYPTSLVRPDKNRVEPRLGVSWRPIPASSFVVRAGYGVYSDTSVYQAAALALAQQAPLSKSLSVQNSASCPLTLANGFTPCVTTTVDTFGVDPNFRVGYAQTWQVALQRDLPQALQVIVTYLGVKGTRGVQEFLPNTYPLGASDSCALCPSGFVYRTSNGDSTREAGSVQLRRRLRSGFTASALYTYSKSIDDDAMLGGQGPIGAGSVTLPAGSAVIAQNWLDLRAERSRSNFDQRHLLTANVQYTTGMGLGGGALLSGWRGRVYKEWTVVTQISAGTGLPETPVYLAAVNGTGFTGSLRPDRTGSPLYGGTGGRFLDSGAFAAPQTGQWGDAGRNSITGPGQLTFNTSLARTFRIEQRMNLDIRADATNLLNHAVFTAYNTTLNPSTDTQSTAFSSPLFGLPTAANPMRSLQVTARLRF